MLSQAKTSRVSILVLVFYTNMLDNLLLTAVVPVIPEILIDLDKKTLEDTIRQEHYSNYINVTDTVFILNQDVKQLNNVTSGTNIGLAKRLLMSFSAVDENSRVGWLLSSKALIQIIANPIAGMLCNRFGYPILLFIGTNTLLLSSLIYIFAASLVPLLLARCIQGIGSAASTIAGMSLLADRYQDDKDRSRAMGMAMGGSALGVVVGYPFGGFLYTYSSKYTPFVTIATFVVLDIVLQLVILRPTLHQKLTIVGTPLHRLVRDPYILVAAGAVMLTTTAMATLEPTVPIWIIDKMHAQKWQLGLVFLPDSIGYFVGANFFGVVAKRMGRWVCSLCSMLLIGICLSLVPLASSVTELILPHFGLGLGLGVTDAAIMPLLALLVDTRHVAVYGSVYAIAQLAVCLAYGIGPSIAGQIVKLVGFSWLMWGIAIINIAFSPLCILLRDPPLKDENKPILESLEKMDNYSDIKSE
ncbi:synaptic vesicular amine transporter-like [Pecten maximus]|uniref:synaptic vesicular amine transporter-like n=1 Tax=Pecten maximus TaxID=6579 RepID=UPI0014589D4A|nr:synaptic vesicular amine transporter-like [Pecten maximus]